MSSSDSRVVLLNSTQFWRFLITAAALKLKCGVQLNGNACRPSG